jgi:uncharacterized protein YjbJ (UPF0337 family)
LWRVIAPFISLGRFMAPPDGQDESTRPRRDQPMSETEGRTEEAKGKLKEAAGAITDDDELRNEGKADSASGKTKQKIDQVKDAAEDAVDRVRDKAKDALDRN